jgi:hypothetical protein
MVDGAADPVRAGETIARLTALLPARAETPAKTLNLTLLTDKQLHALHKLVAICTGEALPKPLPVDRRTERHFDCLDLAAWLDGLPKGHALTRQEISELAGMITAVISEFILPVDLWSTVYGGVVHQEHVEPPSNVVSLRR